MILVRLSFGILLALAVAVAPGRVYAQQADIFTVTGVRVDVTDENVAAARDKGMAEAQATALHRLLQRLTLRSDAGRLPNPAFNDIVNMVQGVSVESEKRSAVRYVAQLSVTFSPEAVRNLLKASDIPFTEVVSKPVLVIPLYQGAPNAEAQLWDEANPWRKAWLYHQSSDSLVPLNVPLGDLTDIRTLSLEQARTVDQAALERISQRNGTGDVLIAHAVVKGGAPVVVEVRGSRVGAGVVDTIPSRSFSGASLNDALANAVEGMASVAEEDWKQRNLMSFGQSSQITVLVQLSHFSDFKKVRQALDQVPVVTKYQVQAAKSDLAQITIDFSGSETRLIRALSQKDLILEPGSSAWRLKLRGAGAAPPPAGAGTAQ